MHFWIDKRAAQLHYGRRRPGPGVFYSRRWTGSKTTNPPNYASPHSSSHNGNSSSSASTSTSAGTATAGTGFPYQNSGSTTNRSNNEMVTPVHRFQPIESIREQAQLACRLGQTLATAEGNTSPSSRRSTTSNSQHLSSHSRSRSRSASRERHGSRCDRSRRRSSSLRDTSSYQSDGGGGGDGGTPIPDYSQQLTSSSLTPSEISDPKWVRTKRIGLTLCFMAFIILMLVTAKFVIEGPSLIDTSRRGQTEATTYFFITELVFVLFAMTLFFTGVACLRKRTNDYLLRHFNQHILQSSSSTGGVPTLISHHQLHSDYFDHSSTHEDDENQDNYFLQHTGSIPPGSGLGYPQQVHHHLLHPGISPTSSLPTCLFRNPLNSSSSNSNPTSGYRNGSANHIISMTPDLVNGASSNSRIHGHPYGSSTQSGRHSHSHHPHCLSGRHHHANMNSQSQLPPPYHIALYLPLPDNGSGHYSNDNDKDATEIQSDVLMKSTLAIENEELQVVSQSGGGSLKDNPVNSSIRSKSGNAENSTTGESINSAANGMTNSGAGYNPNLFPTGVVDDEEDKPETPPPRYEEFRFTF